MGREEQQSDGGPFEIKLGFAAAICPNCEVAREPGVCPECGAKIPEVEPGKLEQTRQKAFASLAGEARELVSSFDDPPKAEVSLGVDQFVACFIDLDVIAKAGEFATLGNRLGELDFNDPTVVGGLARRTIVEYLERIRGLRRDLWELARFHAEGPAIELREVAFDIGRWAAEVVDTFLRALTSSSMSGVREATAVIHERLEHSPFHNRFGHVMEELPAWETPNDDARISVALGRESTYTDEDGHLVLEAILGAFAHEAEPYKELGAAASRYFESVIGHGAAEGEASALLIVPAATMATLDRPLLAHRLARLVHHLIGRALAVDRAAVEAAAGRAAEQAPLILASASRIQKEFRLLSKVAERDEIGDEIVVAALLDAHRQLLESSYRTLGAVLLDLSQIERGQGPRLEDGPPMLGTLMQRLEASSDPALQQLGAAADVALRNATTHSQYRWDSEKEEVRDLKTGQTWPWHELERTVEALVSTLAGVDAAWACLVVREDFELTPSWLGEADAGDVTILSATLSFSAHGFTVTDVEHGGATVVIQRPDTTDPARLIPPLAGMTTIAQDRDRYVVRVADGEDLIAIDGVHLRRATDAEPEMKDLAVQEVTLNAMINSGRNPTDALLEIAVLDAKVIAVTALQELAADLERDAALERLARRVGYLDQLVRPHRKERRELDRLVGKLDRLAAGARSATDGPNEWRRLCDQLTGLTAWADKRGISWPPRLGRD
jgi:hypothetical protein